MQALVEVVLPVFLVIGLGYLARWRNWFPEDSVEGLMRFAQGFAMPCLLFAGISTLDLGQSFEVPLLAAFYAGAVTGFAAGLLGARLIFGRAWEDAVAIGFVCLFSNSLLLGLPITERAYGTAALGPNFAIIALHVPICYGIGVTAMEIARNRGGGAAGMAARIGRSMFRNPLVIALALGFLLNVSGLALPGAMSAALDLMVRAALPAALFGLGGVLCRYRPEGDMRTILYVCAVSLLLHPLVTWGLGLAFHLSTGQLRSAVLTAAMAPGINAYLFASLYGVAKRVAASSVLLATAMSVITVWGWLALLP